MRKRRVHCHLWLELRIRGRGGGGGSTLRSNNNNNPYYLMIPLSVLKWICRFNGTDHSWRPARPLHMALVTLVIGAWRGAVNMKLSGKSQVAKNRPPAGNASSPAVCAVLQLDSHRSLGRVTDEGLDPCGWRSSEWRRHCVHGGEWNDDRRGGY